VVRVACFLLLVAGYTAFHFNMVPGGDAAHTPSSNVRGGSRSLNSNYPPTIFSEEERSNGAIVLHIIGVIYMFLGLAVVCDEYVLC